MRALHLSPVAAAMPGLDGIEGLEGLHWSPVAAAMPGLESIEGLEGLHWSPVAAAMRGLEGIEAGHGPMSPPDGGPYHHTGGGPSPEPWHRDIRDHTIIRGGSEP